MCCKRANIQHTAENRDLECGNEAVAPGPALGGFILAEVGGENELFRGR